MRLNIALLLSFVLASSASAVSEPALRFQVPATVSPQGASDLAAIYAAASRQPPATKPASIEDWDRLRAAVDRRMIPASNAVVAKRAARAANDDGLDSLRRRSDCDEACRCDSKRQ